MDYIQRLTSKLGEDPDEDADFEKAPRDLVEQGTHSGSPGQSPEVMSDEEGVDYTRETAYGMAHNTVEIDTPEKFERAEETKQRFSQVENVNQKLKRMGDLRRYVVSETDVPPGAYKHEDDFGVFYYKELDEDIRPSHVAKYAGVEHAVELEKDERIVQTVALMAQMYKNPFLNAEEQEAVANWLERNLVLDDDDLGSEDTFSASFKDEVAEKVASVDLDELDD